jgi:hypothetical protein
MHAAKVDCQLPVIFPVRDCDNDWFAARILRTDVFIQGKKVLKK